MSVHVHAALQAVGRLHRDRAHAAFAEVLFDLGDDVDLLARGQGRHDAERVVDGGQVSALELDVDDGADDLDDLADFRVMLLLSPYLSLTVACAPETTSMISRVIAA